MGARSGLCSCGAGHCPLGMPCLSFPFLLDVILGCFPGFGVRRGEKLRVRPAQCLGESWGARSVPPRTPPALGGHLGHFPFPKTQREVKQERGCARGAAPAGQVPAPARAPGMRFRCLCHRPRPGRPRCPQGPAGTAAVPLGAMVTGDIEGRGCARSTAAPMGAGGAGAKPLAPRSSPGCRWHRLLLVPVCRGHFGGPGPCSVGTLGALRAAGLGPRSGRGNEAFPGGGRLFAHRAHRPRALPRAPPLHPSGFLQPLIHLGRFSSHCFPVNLHEQRPGGCRALAGPPPCLSFPIPTRSSSDGILDPWLRRPRGARRSLPAPLLLELLFGGGVPSPRGRELGGN